MHLQIVCTQIIFYKYSTVRDIYIFFWFKVKRAIRRDLLMIASLYISHTTQDVTAALGNNRVKQGIHVTINTKNPVQLFNPSGKHLKNC